jgi:hypothetical protein
MFRLMLALFGWMFTMLLDTEGGGGDDDPPKEDPPKDDPPEYKYTDKDLDKYKGTARKEGRQAAERELAEQLGVSIDEAKQIIKNHQAEQEKQKTDLDREKEARRKAEETATAKEKAANERIKKTELKLALRNADINPERLDMALRLADLDKLTIADDGNVEGLDEVVSAVSEASPEWFVSEDDKRRRSAPEIRSKNGHKGLDTQIAEAREKNDWRTVERLNAQKLQQQKG